MFNRTHGVPADRFVEEQLFEEDVRAVLAMMRPNRRERLQGWREYRTGGAQFRVTVSWHPEFGADIDEGVVVPHLAEVLESILVGSATRQDELTPRQEFSMYRQIVRELFHRLNELESRYY